MNRTTESERSRSTGRFPHDWMLMALAMLAFSACTPHLDTRVKSRGSMMPSFEVESPSTGTDPANLPFGNSGAATGDVNGDGREDILVLNDDSTLSVFLTNGGATPSFTLSQTLDVGDQPRASAVADFDGDGALDVAVANRSSQNISVALGQGDGTFAATSTIKVGGLGPTDIVAADLDGDGKVDLATSNAFTHDASVLIGDGAGGFTLRDRYSLAAMPMALAAGEVTGDGLIDLVSASARAGVSVLVGDGRGGFQPLRSRSQLPASGFPFARDTWLAADVVLSDFNGDGQLDIANVSVARGVVRLSLGGESLGDPDRTMTLTYATGDGPRALVVEDLNEDGFTDIAVLNSLSNEVSILLGMGNRSEESAVPLFTRPVNFLVPPDAIDVTVGRFDDGARPDLVVTNGSNAGDGSGSASFAMGSSSGLVLPPSIVSVAPPMGTVAGGTRIEITGLNFQSGARVFVDGVEATAVVVSPQNRIEATVAAAAGGSSGPVEVRVINPNGQVAVRPGAFTYKKMVTENLAFTRLAYCNDGVEPGGVPTLPDCSDLIRVFKDADAADFNGDGLIDVLSAAADNASSADLFFLNQGTRTFHNVTHDDGGSGVIATGLFELHDGPPGTDPAQPRYDIQHANFILDSSGEFSDRRIDVVSVDGFRIRLLENTGNDSDGVPILVDRAGPRLFDLTSDIDLDYDVDPPNSFVWDDVDIGDIDLDGDLDIALANRNVHRVPFNQGGDRGTFLLINDDGLGTFSPFSIPFPADSSSHDVELADIDDDCDLDLIYAGNTALAPGGPPRVFINGIRSDCADAPGTLAFTEDSSRLNTSTPFGDQFTFVGAESLSGPLDFNRDGFVDFVLGGSGRNSLMLNRGGSEAGTFDEVEVRATADPLVTEDLLPQGGHTYGGHFGDLDLDGVVDMVLGDYNGRPVVFLNRIAAGATKADIEAMEMPFEEWPPRSGVAGRGDPDTFWPSQNPMSEPDDQIADANGNGFLETGGPQMGVELRDYDGDNDLDVFFSYGDGPTPRLNRVFLNDHRAEDAGIGGTTGRNDEGREVVHWRNEVQFACFDNGSVQEVRLSIHAAEPAGEPPLTATKTRAQAALENIDFNGDGLFDFVFTIAELFPRHGDTAILFEYDVELSSGAILTLTKNQNIFIDPSGIVFDNQTKLPIIGARVDLEVQTVTGDWISPALAEIQPPVNPQFTGSDGGYGWDTVPGTYRVRVSADGYESAISRVVTVPPPVLDLDVGLEPIETPHLVWKETVRIRKRKGVKWIGLDLDESLRQQILAIAGDAEMTFVEAEPGTVFKGELLNWPLSEIHFELDPKTGSVHGDLDVRQVRAQADPFFLALLEVHDAAGSVLAEIWLEIEFDTP